MRSTIVRVLGGALLGFVSGAMIGALIVEIIALAILMSDEGMSTVKLLEISYILSLAAIAGALIQGIRAGWPSTTAEIGRVSPFSGYAKRFGIWLTLLVAIWASFAGFSSACRYLAAGVFTGQRYHDLEPSGYWCRVLNDRNGKHDRAIRALEKLGPDEEGVVPALAKTLKNPDRNVRMRAVDVLNKFGAKAESAGPALIEAVKEDPDAEIRSDAISALKKVARDQKPLIPIYENALRDPDRKVVGSAMGAIRDIGPPAEEAIPALIEILAQDGKDGNDDMAVSALGGVGLKAVPALSRLLRKTENSSVCMQIARIMCRIGSDAIPGLIELLSDKQNPNRRYAAHALGQLRTPDGRVATALLGALSDDDPYVRSWVMDALGDLGAAAKAAVPNLRKAKETEMGRGREAAVKALERILSFHSETATVDELVKVLTNPDKIEDWLAAAEELPKRGADAKKAVPALIRGLQDPNDAKRFRAAIALSRIDPEAADVIPTLRQSLRASRWYGEVVEIIIQRGEAARSSLPELFEAMNEKKAPYRSEFARAIWLIDRDQRALPVLLDSWTSHPFAPYEADAIPFLIESLRDPDSAIRYKAARLLGRMGPRAKPAVPALVKAKEKANSAFFAEDDFTEALERIEPGKVFRIRLETYLANSLIGGSAVATAVLLVIFFLRYSRGRPGRPLAVSAMGDGEL